MAPHNEPISVRTARLNNLILGKGNGVVQKQHQNYTITGRRSICGNNGSSSSTLSTAALEAISRESLLDAFCLLYNECDKEALKKRDRNIAEFVNKYRSVIEETKHLRVNAEDFVIKDVIGKGYFGNVHLVAERQTGDVYAMKKIKKSVVTTAQVREERDIMSRRCSEWITCLQYAFQDNECLYLVMEYLPGGDLLSLMSRLGAFDEDMTRFYLAELAMALNTLHTMGYVHRDVKPENILIDRFGHIKLGDFGNAAALDRDGNVLSISPVGTPDYIAPELLQTISAYKFTKSMHDVSCDFWSMGIIGYELVCEVTPFHEDNVHETYSKILSHCEDSQLQELITFPNELRLSEAFKNLIRNLITNPTNRLTYDKICKHKFFESIHWETLRSQVPPIIPTVNGEDDTSNFDEAVRSKSRADTFMKKSLTANMRSNDFSGKDMPFIGYSFVHLEQKNSADEVAQQEDTRIAKLSNKLKELQQKLKERSDEITQLKQELVRAEQMTKQSESQSKILEDAKAEINKMKNIIKDKTVELAQYKMQIKTLQSSVKIEEEMWEKKEATITELLRMNRKKYEEAKVASEQRYEKLIAEKKNELLLTIKKLDARESELNAKNGECTQLREKMEQYKEMLRQFKEQAQSDKEEFEKSKVHLTTAYEEKLLELRKKLRSENEVKSRLTMELRDTRSELSESNKSTEEVKLAKAKSHEEILKRLNREIEANNRLHTENTELLERLAKAERAAFDLQQDNNRLERDIQVLDCAKNLAESEMAAMQSSPYETAPGSLTELHLIEEQLRADLEVAKENEKAQKERADKLQDIVEKLEEMMGKLNEHTTASPTKPYPAPRNGVPSSVGDMLEKQNEKLEDKLAAVREQMIVERQAARTANLALWKVEKKLEETEGEKKLLQRRMELTEERIKRTQNERDDAQRLQKQAQEELKRHDERLLELKNEIAALKKDVATERRKFERAEEERMKSKSEIIEHIANVERMEERTTEMRLKYEQAQKKCDGLSLENKRLQRELTEERNKCSASSDNQSQLELRLRNLKDNYDRLKFACTVTDRQLTEIEAMLEAEQKRNKSQQEQIDKLYGNVREKDEKIAQLKQELHEEHAQLKAANTRIQTLTQELQEQKHTNSDIQRKLIAQQEQLVEQTNKLFSQEEQTEILSNEVQNLQTIQQNGEREIHLLKEENARLLTDLYHAKQESHRLAGELKEAIAHSNDLQAELDEAQQLLHEKEEHYVQREIKSEATLAQHKKLIDYLQLKVEDLSQKKKKTIADVLFGSSSHTHASSKKDLQLTSSAIESSILYRALQEELRREQQRAKALQEQLDKLNANNSTLSNTLGRTPLKSINRSETTHEAQKEKSVLSPSKQRNTFPKSPHKQRNEKTTATTKTQTEKRETKPDTKAAVTSPAKKKDSLKRVAPDQHHRFEFALQECKNITDKCVACDELLIAGSPYWKCRECKQSAHRKCRSAVNTECGGIAMVLSKNSCTDIMPKATAPTVSDLESNVGDNISVQYSYEGKLDSGESTENLALASAHYKGQLVYSGDKVDIKCAYEMELENILLLGCSDGLYAYHVPQKQLVQINGINSAICIAISTALAKTIMVDANGEALYQCDLRQLQSRCQASPSCVRTTLDASVINLPFANRQPSEKWQLVKISNECENALDSVAIACTSTRIVILKYDMKMQKFKPVRALDTATPVTSILFTRHTAIVASDKFFEIDLSTFAAEEFLDMSDQSLLHTLTCQPVVAIRITSREFLLCYMECGVFVDEYGCRSRPYDISWEYTPTGFMYREPFLYVAHFQSVQILRLRRSYSHELASAGKENTTEGSEDDAAEMSHIKRANLSVYMPTLLADSGDTNVYALAMDKRSGTQQVYHLNAGKLFKNKLAPSQETLSSITTSLTRSSIATTDSI